MSQYRTDWFFWTQRRDRFFVATMVGQFRIEHTRSPDPLPEFGFRHESEPPVVLERVPGSNIYIWSHGFGLVTGERWSDKHHVLLLPYWFLVSSFLCLPVLYAWKQLKPKRRDRGRCPACGYDLRATPQRCPECGTIPSSVKGVVT
jgi:hypothetical protein